MINCIRPSVRYFNKVFAELWFRNWSRACRLECRSSCLCQQVSKRTLSDPNPNCALHFSAVKFGSMFGYFPSLCMTNCPLAGPRQRRGNVALILGILRECFGDHLWLVRISSRFSPNTHVVSMCLFHALMATGKPSVPRCSSWRHLAGMGANRSGGGWRCEFRMKRNRPPDARIQILGLGLGDCRFSIFYTVSVLSVSGANSDD